MSSENILLLKTASEEGNVDEVKRFIEKENINVDQADEFGDTALHAACAKGRLDVVKYLLSKGANPNVKNNIGSTPLHKLATSSYDQLPIAKLMLRNNADPTIRNAAGFLPEQLASYSKLKEELLGDQGVTEEMNVHKMHFGRVIGKGGAKLREIQDATGAVVTIPRQGEESNKITVKGRRDSVDEAKKLIQEAINAGKKENEEEENRPHTKLPIAKDKHRFIIGRGGEKINELRDEFNVEIKIPLQRDPDTNVVIIGESIEDVDGAVKRIMEIVKEASQRDAARNEGRGNGRGRGEGRGGYGQGEEGRGYGRREGGRGGYGEEEGRGYGRGEGERGYGRREGGRGGYGEEEGRGYGRGEGERGRGRGRGRGGPSDNNNNNNNNNNANGGPPKKRGGGRGKPSE